MKIVSTEEMTTEEVRQTLSILNKQMRREALSEGEKAALLKVREVSEILKLIKSDPKEAAGRMDKYRESLASRLRGGVSAPSVKRSTEGDKSVIPASKKVRVDASSTPAPSTSDFYEPISPGEEHVDEPMITEPCINIPKCTSGPSGPPPASFSGSWVRHFFQQMCSKVPHHEDASFLKSVGQRVVEKNEEQLIFVDGMAASDILLLMEFVQNLQYHVLDKRRAGNADFAVPSKLGLLNRMPDPLDSGLLDSWYFSVPSLCATCALRFPNRKVLTNHHDYHFVKNTAYGRRKRGLDVAFRGWMESPQDWLGNRAVLLSRQFYRKLDSSASENQPEQNKQSHKSINLDKSEKTANLLRNAVPADAIKCRCAECGDGFDREWTDEPVNMAVFKDAVCVPLFGSEPVVFNWPGVERLEQGRGTEAVTALEDKRIRNSVFYHSQCWNSNKSLGNKEYQIQLFDQLTAETQIPDKDLEQIVQEEILEEELEVGKSSTRKYF